MLDPPVNTSNALLYDALDLLKHVGVFFIDPVSQVATVIQDLIENQKLTDGFKKSITNTFI